MNIPSLQWPDALVGCLCLITLLFMKSLPNLKFVKTNSGRYGPKIAWFLSISRNAIVVLFCTTIAYCIETPLRLTGNIETGLPPLSLPNYGLEGDLTEIMATLGPIIFTLPLVNILIQVSVAKSFCKYNENRS